MRLDRHLRPYPLEITGTHPNSEVKSVRAGPSTEMSDLSGTVGAVVFAISSTVTTVYIGLTVLKLPDE